MRLPVVLMSAILLPWLSMDAPGACRLRFAGPDRIVVLENDLVRLTATESTLMRIFSAVPHSPVSRAKLVEDLGGDRGQAQERAVDVQITRLRRKIETDPKSPRYLQTVRGAGYMLAPD